MHNSMAMPIMNIFYYKKNPQTESVNVKNYEKYKFN